MQSSAYDEAIWRQRLREANLRITSIRLRVIRAMVEHGAPANAQDILAALPDGAADRVTVYRTLNTLVRAGLAQRADPGDRVWRYTLVERSHAEHPHLVCDACGAVRCLDNASIRVAFDGTREEREVTITQSDVYLHGACEECATGRNDGSGMQR